MIHSITRAMLQEEYWKDMDTPQLVHLRQAIQLDTENFRRGIRGCYAAEEYEVNVPELVARTNAISKLTERISGMAPAPVPVPVPVRMDYRAQCPKCWRGVRVNEADCVPAETAYLWGVVQVYGVGKTLDLRCRQCKGIRWRK